VCGPAIARRTVLALLRNRVLPVRAAVALIIANLRLLRCRRLLDLGLGLLALFHLWLGLPLRFPLGDGCGRHTLQMTAPSVPACTLRTCLYLRRGAASSRLFCSRSE